MRASVAAGVVFSSVVPGAVAVFCGRGVGLLLLPPHAVQQRTMQSTERTAAISFRNFRE
jgi:hypothetical protein